MRIEKALPLLALGLALGACSMTSRSGMIEDTTIGEAKAITMRAQIIDPNPQYEYLDPMTSADHAAQAIARYRTDRVKKPERVRSTDVTGK